MTQNDTLLSPFPPQTCRGRPCACPSPMPAPPTPYPANPNDSLARSTMYLLMLSDDVAPGDGAFST